MLRRIVIGAAAAVVMGGVVGALCALDVLPWDAEAAVLFGGFAGAFAAGALVG